MNPALPDRTAAGTTSQIADFWVAFLVREKQFGEQWAIEDKQAREKLAALEK